MNRPARSLDRDELGHAAVNAAMDVVLLPTYREGFPVVLMEAAAMELPVVPPKWPAAWTPFRTA
jgi:glycosyltransferase involved in cell wall biosynthesis